jgi:hypothetical protein
MKTLRDRDRIMVRVTVHGPLGDAEAWKVGVVCVSEPRYRHLDAPGEHVSLCAHAAAQAHDCAASCTALASGEVVRVEGEGIFEVAHLSDRHGAAYVWFRPVAEVRS